MILLLCTIHSYISEFIHVEIMSEIIQESNINLNSSCSHISIKVLIPKVESLIISICLNEYNSYYRYLYCKNKFLKNSCIKYISSNCL